MAGIIFYIAFIGFFVYWINKRKSAAKDAPSSQKNRFNAAGAASERQRRMNNVAMKKALNSKGGPMAGNSVEGKAYLKMDDRKNDWLAKQLEEEKWAERRVRLMFGLTYNAKEDHAAHCDARAVKQEHSENCDANGVDTAGGK